MSGYDPQRDILPITVVSREGYPTPKPIKGGWQSFRGTGFLIGKNVLVTCWHCVSAELEDDDTYAVSLPIRYAERLKGEVPPDSQYVVANLQDIAQHPAGADLATARVSLDPVGLSLGRDTTLPFGAEFWTFGYPLTDDVPHPESGRALTLNGRYLKGYLVRDFWNEVPGFGQTPSYELDMPAPRGLSGSPIVRYGSSEVIGVVYGVKESETIEQFAEVKESGERRPQVVQLTTFAAAHHNRTLRNLQGPATQGLPLAEYLQT